MAVSPFQVLYAQEAREYSLWTVTILLSTAALLKAMRSPSHSSWGIYTVSLTLGFYKTILSTLVAMGQGI
ncbi:MAG: hypothetical protein F6J89_22180 [Symploca sp. SIO1C4]|uniref:Uncharacterized protein n=1 Tax=Symploca sp. SIO1C4 TaxID=2607765 RepID=A0A6B3NH60_9CYAN|nr:hypothetical protein [Symploca sp. SIO1C4]